MMVKNIHRRNWDTEGGMGTFQSVCGHPRGGFIGKFTARLDAIGVFSTLFAGVSSVSNHAIAAVEYAASSFMGQ